MANRESKMLRLYLIEEQEVYRAVYHLIFGSRGSIDLVGVSPCIEAGVMRDVVSRFQPDVLLLGPKELRRHMIGELGEIRISNNGLGIILFLAFYEAGDVRLLQNVALSGKGGMAVLLKQSLDQLDELRGTVLAVNRGQVFFDPTLTTSRSEDAPVRRLLKQLTTRQSEILSLLAKGYTNPAIADTLCIDVKTVEHHLDSVYAKLKAGADFSDKHPRVCAAKLYLEAAQMEAASTLAGNHRESA